MELVVIFHPRVSIFLEPIGSTATAGAQIPSICSVSLPGQMPVQASLTYLPGVSRMAGSQIALRVCMPACTLVVLLEHPKGLHASRDASALGALTSLLRRKVSWKLETPLSLISQSKSSGRVSVATGGTSVLWTVGRDKGTP